MPEQHSSESRDLPGFIRAHRSDIVESWAAITRPQLSPQPSRKLSFEEFRDGVPVALDLLVKFLEHRKNLEQSSEFDEATIHHGHCRWKQGFNLRDLIRDWGNLQRVVLEWVNRFYQSGEASAKETLQHSRVVELVVSFFTEAICSSVDYFDQHRKGEAARLGRELERMRRHFDRIGYLRKRTHEIRGPLTAISAASSVLKADESESHHGDLSDVGFILDESVASAMEVLDSLRDLSQIDAGQVELSLESVDVAALLREFLGGEGRPAEEASGSGGFDLVAPESLEVEADAAKLRKTFESLLRIVRAGGGNEQAARGRLTLRPLEDGWELQVSHDTPDTPGKDEHESAEEEIDALMLGRLCEIQSAGYKREKSDSGRQSITLLFPGRPET